MLPQSYRAVATTSKNKCPASSEKLETCSSSARNVGSNIKHKKSGATLVERRKVLGVPSAIDESGISICSTPTNLTCTSRSGDVQKLNSDREIPRHHGTVCTSPKVTNNNLQPSPESNANKVTKEDAAKETQVNETEELVTGTNREENAQLLSEMIETMPLPRDTNVPGERVLVRKADLAALKFRISRVIGRLKEDLAEFTAIADVISTINSAGKINNEESKEGMDQQTTEDENTSNLSENTIIYLPEKDESQPSRQVGFSLDSESNKENEDNKSNNVKCSENEIKSKTKRRRSARLMAKSLNNLCSFSNNDSFVDLENELNITHANSSTKCASAKKYKTPDMSKYKR